MLRGVLIRKEANKTAKKAESKNRPPWFDLPTHKPGSQLKDRRHAVVVGAGITGITTACALAKRGSVKGSEPFKESLVGGSLDV